jgi:hypothetical protein
MAWMDDNRYTGLAGDQVFTGVNWAWSQVGPDDVSEGTTVIQNRQYGGLLFKGLFLHSPLCFYFFVHVCRTMFRLDSIRA